MIELKYLDVHKCPYCECNELVGEYIETSGVNGGKIRQHINGKRWETRKFSCGYTVQFVPNFNDTTEIHHCKNSNDEQQIQEQVNILKSEVETFATNLGLHHSTIQHMINCIDRKDAISHINQSY